MFEYPKQYKIFIGVDEVGRGPLVGSVISAAVILNSTKPISGLMDSKKISEKKRTLIANDIKNSAIAWAIGEATHQEIDQINILQATLLSMQRAIQKVLLNNVADCALIDGNKTPNLPIPAISIVKGDNLVPEISAASIIAKVTRDEMMLELDTKYPQYGFAKHKGYPTKEHLNNIKKYGIFNGYRLTYSPIKQFFTK